VPLQGARATGPALLSRTDPCSELLQQRDAARTPAPAHTCPPLSQESCRRHHHCCWVSSSCCRPTSHPPSLLPPLAPTSATCQCTSRQAVTLRFSSCEEERTILLCALETHPPPPQREYQPLSTSRQRFRASDVSSQPVGMACEPLSINLILPL
jgi:hypothetical protein